MFNRERGCAMYRMGGKLLMAGAVLTGAMLAFHAADANGVGGATAVGVPLIPPAASHDRVIVDITNTPDPMPYEPLCITEMVYSKNVGSFWDDDDDGLVDDNTGNWIGLEFISRFGADFDGYIGLDWEDTPIIEGLNKSPSHPDYQSVIQEFIEIAQIVRQAIPNAKIGFYGYPLKLSTSRWDANHNDVIDPSEWDAWHASGMGMAAAYKYCDWLAPTMYTGNTLYNESARQSRRSHIQINLSMYIDLAIEVEAIWAAEGDPDREMQICPYFRHRNASNLYPHSDYVWTQNIRWMLDHNHMNRSIDGMTYWSCDYYSLGVGEMDNLPEMEAMFPPLTPTQVKRDYLLDLHDHYLELMDQEMCLYVNNP